MSAADDGVTDGVDASTAGVGAGASRSALSYFDMYIATSAFFSIELFLCLALMQFTFSSLLELQKAGLSVPSRKDKDSVQKVQQDAYNSFVRYLSACTDAELKRCLVQFTQHSQLGEKLQMSGNFPNTVKDVYEKWHTVHYSDAHDIVEPIMCELHRRGAIISRRRLKKLDGSCATCRSDALRFGSGRALKDEIDGILKTNNKSVDALRKTLSNTSLKPEIKIQKQEELDAILKDPAYLRIQAYYAEMLLQLAEIEETAKEGDSFEAFFLDREKCDVSSARTPLTGRLIVPHFDDSLDVPEGSLDELDAIFAEESKTHINEILQAQGKEPTYRFERILLTKDPRSKTSKQLSSSSFEGVIWYWIVEFKGVTYYVRLKQKRDEMNHQPGSMSCVFTPGSPFTKEVYHTAMDVMLRERKAQRELEAQHKLEAYHAHKNLFSNVLGEIAKHSVHGDE
jgi:hypothetical protein